MYVHYPSIHIYRYTYISKYIHPYIYIYIYVYINLYIESIYLHLQCLSVQSRHLYIISIHISACLQIPSIYIQHPFIYNIYQSNLSTYFSLFFYRSIHLCLSVQLQYVLPHLSPSLTLSGSLSFPLSLSSLFPSVSPFLSLNICLSPTSFNPNYLISRLSIFLSMSINYICSPSSPPIFCKKSRYFCFSRKRRSVFISINFYSAAAKRNFTSTRFHFATFFDNV